MRTWLLLVSLLVSGLSPLGDRDWIMDHLSRPWCCKLLLRRQKTPSKGLETLLRRTGYRSASFRRHDWTCRVHNNHGHVHQDVAGIIHGINFPALAVSPSHEEGNRVLTFPAMSNNLPARHVIFKISHIAVDIIRSSLEARSARLRHQSTTSGNDFSAFVLKKSKNWAPITFTQLQEMLTKRCCTAAAVIISRCAEDGETRTAMSIKAASKQEAAQPQVREKQNTKRAVDIKMLMQHDGKWFLISHDCQLTTLQSGSCPTNNSDTSQLEIRRQPATAMKTNEHLDLDKGSDLQKKFQKQLSLKAAGNAGGFYVQRQLLLGSRENKRPIKRPKYVIRPAQEDNDKYFIWKIIMTEATLRCLEAHAHIIKNGSQKILAYIRQTHSPQKTHHDDINITHVLSDKGEALIMLFLQEMQTETYNIRKLRWKTEMDVGGPPPITVAIKDFIPEADQSKSKCSSHFLELYAMESREMISLRSSKRVAEGTTEHPAATDAPQKNVSIHHIKDENMTSAESVTPPPLSFKMMQTETTTGVSEVNTETQKTIAINEISTETADGQLITVQSSQTARTPELQTDNGPKFLKYTTESTLTMTKNMLWGLRMIEDIPTIATKLHRGMDNEDGAPTNWDKTEGKDQKNPGETPSKPSEAVQEAADNHSKTTGDTVPVCRGLIHRTKAGWKHCMDRLRGPASKIFSTSEAPEAGELEKDPSRAGHHNPLNHDENDHFYYFNGVLKRVQNNFYPYYERQRRRHSEEEDSKETERKKRSKQENLLSYIQHLTERNKLKNLK